LTIQKHKTASVVCWDSKSNQFRAGYT